MGTYVPHSPRRRRPDPRDQVTTTNERSPRIFAKLRHHRSVFQPHVVFAGGTMATMAAPAAVGVKMLKHVAKYPHDNINGLLIGKQSAEGVTIVDAVPLFSGYLELSPMLEVAMEQVTAWAKKNGNVVVGYYECRTSKAPSPQSVQ